MHTAFGWVPGIAAVLAPASASAAPKAWFGTWHLSAKDAGDKPETLIYSDAGDGAMRMVSVENGSIIVTRLDGRPAADRGSGAAKRHALAVRALSPTSYAWTFLVAGRPWVRGRNTLSPDLRRFTETSWLVAKPGDRVTLTYERE